MAMSMGSASMAMSMAMSTGTATASSHMASSTAMSSMDSMDSSGMMGMDMMMMTFFTSTATPLFSSSWVPATTGQYAGTCIFLVALTVFFRAILALRSNFGSVLTAYQYRTHTPILRSDFDDKDGGHARCATRKPWKINEAVLRGLLDTVIAGIAYLLMIAVMTMNVGYFMSVLGGTFLGSFIFGGWTVATSH